MKISRRGLTLFVMLIAVAWGQELRPTLTIQSNIQDTVLVNLHIISDLRDTVHQRYLISHVRFENCYIQDVGSKLVFRHCEFYECDIQTGITEIWDSNIWVHKRKRSQPAQSQCFLSLLFFETERAKSLDCSKGVHVYSWEGLKHRSDTHYNKLREIFYNELDLKPSNSPIHVVFVSDSIYDRFAKFNPIYADTNTMAFALMPDIMVLRAALESDGQFFHELAHIEKWNERILKDVSRGTETAIQKLESSLLVARKYVEYLMKIVE